MSANNGVSVLGKVGTEVKHSKIKRGKKEISVLEFTVVFRDQYFGEKNEILFRDLEIPILLDGARADMFIKQIKPGVVIKIDGKLEPYRENMGSFKIYGDVVTIPLDDDDDYDDYDYDDDDYDDKPF